jgi:hypothetical protein
VDYAYDDEVISVPVETEPCLDKAAAGTCDKWALAGECEQNPAFMHRQCKRACGLCPVTGQPASVGTAQSTPPPREPAAVEQTGPAEQRASAGGSVPVAPGGAVTQPAPADQPSALLAGNSAISAGNCADDEARCDMWAASGECRLNPSFMTVHCRKSCGVCA